MTDDTITQEPAQESLYPMYRPQMMVTGSVEARTKLWTAIARARAAFKPIGKNTEGRKGNQVFKYAPLSAIFEGVDQALADNEIAFHQQITSSGGLTTTVTTIVAGHGAEIWGELSFERPPFGENGFSVKDYGALLTYYRRYAAQTAFGVEGDKDLDDGDSPVDTHQERRPAPRQQQQPAQPKPRREQQQPAQSKPRREQPKPAAAKEQKATPALSDEMVEMVAAALDRIVGDNGRPKLATVADVTAAFNAHHGNPQVNDNTVAYALTLAAKRSRCGSAKKGDITVYVGKSQEDVAEETAEDTERPEEASHESTESKPRTEEQVARIQELAQIIWGGQDEDALRKRLRRYVYKTLGLEDPKKLDFDGCEKLIEAMEQDPKARV